MNGTKPNIFCFRRVLFYHPKNSVISENDTEIQSVKKKAKTIRWCVCVCVCVCVCGENVINDSPVNEKLKKHKYTSRVT